MTARAWRPCRRPGCPGLAMPPAIYCDKHADLPTPTQEYDKLRGSAAARGYDAAWRALREVALRRDKYTCQYCYKRGVVKAAEDVHHLKPVTEYPELRLVLDNLLSACHACNLAEDRKRRASGVARVPPKKTGGFF
jgi:5-methylcytosine-specific restriction protein A